MSGRRPGRSTHTPSVIKLFAASVRPVPLCTTGIPKRRDVSILTATDNQLTTSLRRNRHHATDQNTVAYDTAAMLPLTMSSTCTGVDSSPSQAVL